MRIRTLSGNSLADAMRKVREEMGPEAVILQVEEAKSGKGVMIRAAAEDTDAPPAAEQTASAEPGARAIIQPQADMERRIERELRQRLRQQRLRHYFHQAIDPDAAIIPALRFHKVPEVLIERMAASCLEADPGPDEDILAHALERAIAFGPLPPRPARPLVVVGSPGHGKSTVLARLAVRAVTAGANPILITTDPAKAGAVSQIETYASLLKAQALIAETPAALSQLVKDHSNSAVFVDTPGLNHLAAEESAGMRDLLNASGGEAVWVCAAGGDTDDLIETAQAYARLGVRRAIFTRLDSTRRLGSIIAAASAGRIAMAHAASSAFLADGLETLNPHGVATRLLQGYATMLPESAPAEAAELNTTSSS